MKRKLLFLKTCLLISFLFIGGDLFAVNIYVNNALTTDDVYTTAAGNAGNNGLTPATPKATLAQALAIAVNGDIIYVDHGNYNDVGLSINKEVQIIGAGEEMTVFKRTSGVNRWGVISVSNVKVSKLTITEYNLASDGIAVSITSGTGIEFNRVTIYANVGSAGQGAVLVTGAATSATFRNSGGPCNRVGAANYGGAFKVVNATLVLDNCSINNNVISALNGGGLLVTGSTANVTVNNCTFDDNEASRGGAICVEGGTVNITGSCFNNNFVRGSVGPEGGGAICIYPTVSSTINIDNCSFTGNDSNANTGSSDGGAISFRNQNGGITITSLISSCSFTNNSAVDDGEDIYFENSFTPTFNITFKNNTFFNVYSGTQVNLYNRDLPTGEIKFEDLGGAIGGNGDIVANGAGVSIDKPEMFGNYTETSSALPSTLPVTRCIDRFDGVCGTASATITCVTENKWDGSSWSKGSAPTIFQHVILNANYNTLTHGNINACQMTVKSGVTLDIVDGANGTYVYVVNSIFNNGTINVSSKANLVQVNHPLDLNNDPIATPNINFTKNTGNKIRWDYVYWGKPVSNSVLSNYNSAFDLKYYWDPDFCVFGVDRSYLGWQALASEPAVGTGFITRVKTSAGLTPTNITLSYSGTSNNGSYTAGIKYYDGNDNAFRNFTLLGNPYPGAIKFEDFYNDNTDKIYGTVYLWSANTPYPGSGEYQQADYASFNLTGGVGVPGASTQTPNGILPNGYIASAQGFMIRPKVNGTVTFNNKHRTKDIPSNNQFYRSVNNIEIDRYWLRLSDENGRYNEQLIGYLPNATNGFDEAYDGPINSLSTVKFYSLLGNEKLIIQGKAPFSVDDKIDIDYSLINLSNSLIISLSKKEGLFENQDIYIHDKMLGFYQNLKDGDYHFTHAVYPNRFEIIYKTRNVNQDIEDIETSVVASFINNQLQVNTREFINEIELYDLNGKLLFHVTKDSSSIKSYLKQITLPTSVYILNVKCVNGYTKSIKLINN
ncbi:hypothetical protein [Flavobacterium sp.]|uniref:hypothetical protein n=1 Tax=Flavobacterium sp. TaxID=239 RepID=UPI003D2B2A97